MATCGYLCPVCEGRGYLEDGEECTYCKPDVSTLPKTMEREVTDEEWLEKVHNSCSCSDIGKQEDFNEEK